MTLRTPKPEALVLSLDDGTELVVALKRSTRAKRLTLRLSAGDGRPVMTLPRRLSLARASRFLSEHEDWLKARIARRAPPVPFAPGETFPFRGRTARIVSEAGAKGVRFRDDGEGWTVTVGGPAADLPRRLHAALRELARERFAEAVGRYAAKLGRTVKRIRITDTTSRWGSCSAAGVLSFSWRLVLAPPAVLDGLAAHEVAHLVEMNHSGRFWALLDGLEPRHREARTWLAANGQTLHAVGRG